MNINDIDKIQNKLKDLQKKKDTIFLIERFIGAAKESKCLDFSSQWGTAPTYCHLGEFNSTRIDRSYIYKLFGKEVIELLNNKINELTKEMDEIDIVEFLKEA